MKQYWTRWEKWISLTAPTLLDSLNPPALQNELDALEKVISTELPLDFKLFYSIHNGQNTTTHGLIDADELMSIEGIISEWNTWSKVIQDEEIKNAKSTPDKGVKDDWWNPFWIPITYDGSGNNICMDLAPATGGTRGQMITMWHDSGYRDIVANSFEEWISNYIASLKMGKGYSLPNGEL